MFIAVDNVIEIGAQWVHGEKGNVVFELASAKDLIAPSDSLFSKTMFVQSSSKIVDAELSTKMWKLLEGVRKVDEDENVLEYKTSGNYFLEK